MEDAFALFLVLGFSLTAKCHGILANLDRHIVATHPRHIGADHELVPALNDVDRRGPVARTGSPAGRVGPRSAEHTREFVLHLPPDQRAGLHRVH